MLMKICHLKIILNTDKGPYGVELRFTEGLNILRADNSMGKSTCINSIFIALGLEAMFTTNRRNLPLTPALTSELYYSDDKVASVLESNIYLEIENEKEKRIVIHRTVKGSRDTSLITVIKGPALSNPTCEYDSEDYFINRGGAAIREKGFHTYLASFMGWDLPKVANYDGGESLLYIQCIFPYFFVEQQRGWSRIEPLIPTHFRIKDIRKRVVEFLLNLDASRNELKRTKLIAEKQKIERKWSEISNEIESSSSSLGAVVKRLPKNPLTRWDTESPPALFFKEEKAECFLRRKKESLESLKNQTIPPVKEVADNLEKSLNHIQEALCKNESILKKLINSYEIDKNQIEGLYQRLDSIDIDLKRYQDLQVLQTLGSTDSMFLRKEICPTCLQKISDNLLDMNRDLSVMSLEENIFYLKQQKKNLKGLLRSSEASLKNKKREIQNIRKENQLFRDKIRSISETLISDNRLPSKDMIKDQIELEIDIKSIERAIERYQILVGDLEDLTNPWSKTLSSIQTLPSDNLSELDKKKLIDQGKLIKEQLRQYDFMSLIDIDSIEISIDTYSPVYQGFDLPTNLSASDHIRLIWSYLFSLLELSRKYEDLNHPGFIVLDEPRQQGAKEVSFSELLQRSYKSIQFGQQIILATSEEEENIDVFFKTDDRVNYINFNDRIIQPLKS